MHPQPETYWGHVNPIGPRGVYDEAKRYAEALTMAYHRQQGVDTAIVRIFNTYGPRMRPHDGRAIPTFLRQALQNRPITVFGDGSQTRSFCYVADLIRGIIALAESGVAPARSTSATRTSSRCCELAETVIEVTGSSSEIVYEALPTDDPQVRQPDITLAEKLLAGSPRSSCARGSRARSTLAGAAALVGARPAVSSIARHPSAMASLHVLERMPTTTRDHERAADAGRASRSAADFALTPQDVRRKRPPALSFLLQLEHAARASRACCRCSRSTSPASGWRSSPRCWSRRSLRERLGPARAVAPDAGHVAFAFLLTVLLFARSGLYADRGERPGHARDRLRRCSR